MPLTPAILVFSLVINTLVLWLASLLAVGGDGSSDGITLVRWVGGAWVGLLFLTSGYLWKRGRNSAAIVLGVATLPLGFAVASILLTASGHVKRLMPNASTFLEVCKTAGVRYLAAPAAPVRSLAFDWDPGSRASDMNTLGIDWNANLTTRGFVAFELAKAVEFFEARCCQFNGRQYQSVGTFVRNEGDRIEGIPAPTADVLVFYQQTTIPAGAKPSYRQTDITITDRRDQRLLATSRTIVDLDKRRACAGADVRHMSEEAFVRQAVGIPPRLANR